MHRFLVTQSLHDDLIVIKDRLLVHQIKRVLRIKKGERVAFFSQSAEFACIDVVAELKNIDGNALVFMVRDRLDNTRESSKQLTLYVSIIKKNHFEWMLEKNTEVGVTEFVPIISLRSEKKNINIARCENIIKEASEQSGRAIIPKLHKPMFFDAALARARESRAKIYFASEGERENMIRGAGDRSVSLFIGPEGGWDPKEISRAVQANCAMVSLGRLILRAETAAVVGSHMLLWG